VGKTATFPLSHLTTVKIEAGRDRISLTAEKEYLNVRGLRTGLVQLRLLTPGRAPEVVRLSLTAPRPLTSTLMQVAPPAPSTAGASGVPGAGTSPDGTVTTASPTSGQAPNLNLGAATTGTGTGTGTPGLLPGVPDTIPNTVPNTLPGFGAAPVPGTAPDLGAVPFGTTPGQSPLSSDFTGQIVPPPAPPLPSLNSYGNNGTAPTDNRTAPARPRSAQPAPNRPTASRSTANRSTASSSGLGSAARPAVRRTAPVAQAPRISPILPAPARNNRANVAYRTAPGLPRSVPASGGNQGITVTQGLARLIRFPSNILAVFFSNPAVMDARAINARTIAVTGIGPGPSTLAVFTSQFPGDAVGRANIYRIQTQSRNGASNQNQVPDARLIGQAITAALGDPRVRATIITLPDGSLAARLAGTVRNQVEVDAAKTTAAFFVPKVIPALYADINAPTIDAVTNGTANLPPEAGLQENLRRITNNQSIELVPLPTGLAFKAEVGSVEEAESLLRVLPTLDQQIIPFIVVRGQQSQERYYNATVPLLTGEDRQLTQKLHDVTGVRSVYAVRTASNGLACYGQVRTRGEYDTVRRYMHVMAQTSVPPAVQGTSQGTTLRPQGLEGAPLPNYDPNGGYRRNLGLQMFVRITDPTQSVIRKVTVETSIIEVSRTALRNLGLEYGTVNLINETVSGGTTTITNNGNQTSPVIVNRTIDPTFNPGTALAGNGFVGGQSLRNINPFRVRLNALISNGDARVLSRPNVTSIEGASAQITIGGERPVPKAVATQGAVGTQVEFRRFGVIISMRPTVTNNNTILLQIRADITQPDRTFEINLNGALIPGETVRSVDTTLNVRPGDTIVMGGLITNDRRQQTSKVPVLGDLPVIGSLFRSRRFENNETELAIFMTPNLDFMPADMETLENSIAIPSFPPLPSRQESNSILFQETTRSAG
jgi:Flp pilus assembly secretin CpaC